MSRNEIRYKAGKIYKADYKNLLIAGLIYAAINILLLRIGMNYALSAIANLFTRIVRASNACFFFAAYRNRHSDFEDMYSLFANPQDLSRVLSILFMMWVINMVCFNFIIPILGVLGIIFAGILNIVLTFSWYLFAANPDYPVGYYIKGLRYVTGGYVLSCIVLMIVPSVINAVLTLFISPAIAQIVCFPINIYVSLTIAGYASEMIPSDWYYGGTYL